MLGLMHFCIVTYINFTSNCFASSSLRPLCLFCVKAVIDVARGLVYTALSALLHCVLSQLVPLAPQLNLIDPNARQEATQSGAAVYPATYRH